jgi:hypothetical protein
MMRIHELPTLVRALHTLPEVSLRLFGDDRCLAIYRSFTGPHARFRFLQSKRWGVALLQLPQSFPAYLTGKSRELLRRKRRKAQRAGLWFGTASPMERLDEILDIHLSLPERQGRALPPEYLDRQAVARSLRSTGELFGVFNQAGTLRAYAHVPILGETFLLSRLLAHGDDLDNGTMYFLISEVVREMIARRDSGGMPKWGMYDTWWGASASLRFFKQRLGFKPYKVRWLWQDC